MFMRIFKLTKFERKIFVSMLCLALMPLIVICIVLFPVAAMEPQNLARILLAIVVLLLVAARLLAARLVAPVKSLTRWVEEAVTSDGVLPGQQGLVVEGELGELAENFARLKNQLSVNLCDNALQNWHKDGETGLHRLLQGDQVLSQFADRTLAFCADYVGAQVGAFFIHGDGRFVLTASYAYKLRSANDNAFRLGEGMVGQAALEKKIIHFQNVPPSHLALRVDSGLGENQPAAIVVVPLVYNDQVLGVFELAGSSGFGAREIQFLEQTAGTIAIALHTAQTRDRIASLLADSQRQSEELQSQQEALKTANEELEEQALQLRESKRLLQEQREELQAANAELEEKTEKLLKQQEEMVKQKAALARIQTGAVPAPEHYFHGAVSGTSRTPSTPPVWQQDSGKQPADHGNTADSDDSSVLIIENDPVFAHILEKMAAKKRFKVLRAENGRAGLQAAEKYRPCAVLLDLGLPDMDGMDVLAALKASKSTRHIPVHVISSLDRDNRVLQKGAIGYLAKSANSEDIEAVFATFERHFKNNPEQLLIVEDDLVCLRDTVKLFQHRHVHITTAGTGKEALQLLSSHQFDAVILDLGLPDMDGFAILDALDEPPPVVVYTGRELTHAEMVRFDEKVNSVVIKGQDSRERLLDEVSLFFHAIQTRTPPEEKQSEKAMRHVGGTNLTGKKVLVVDDDMRNTFALGKILKKADMLPVSAADGLLALERLAETADIDLVLMDIMMPNMDGYEAIRRIRAMNNYQKLPIIALTAKAMGDDRNKCLQAGASDYLAKPVDKEKLLSMIRVWIGNGAYV